MSKVFTKVLKRGFYTRVKGGEDCNRHSEETPEPMFTQGGLS